MILIFKKKKVYLTVLAIALVVAIVFIFSNQTIALAMNSISSRKIPIYSVDRQDSKIALTFDAAWGSDKTQGILDILKKHNVKATFFLVDFWIEENEDLVKKIFSQDLEIGNHSLTHLDMTTLNEEQRKNEIRIVNNKIKSITGKDVKFFRFPFGAYDNKSISSVEKENLIAIQWDVDSLDWKGLEKEEILNRIKQKVKSGSIILFHNNSDHILDALESVIAYLKSKDFNMVTLSELVYEDNYSIDSNGIQHKN